ncbi:MAG: hypothetical protein K2Z81_11865, partial [Cyanobacteria bacterium]|nr:hypothetical protein [Cyanobacteriota bacterium]
MALRKTLFIILGIAVVALLIAIPTIWFGFFFTTEQNTVRFVKRFGDLKKIGRAGLGKKAIFIDTVSAPFSLQVAQEDITETVLDKNDVPVHITCSVLFRPGTTDDQLKNAYFTLSNPRQQIKSHVANALRAKSRQMTFSEILERRDEIKTYVRGELQHTMDAYGWIIDDALVPSALPDKKVLDAMNDKVASEQKKTTAINEAEAEYTRKVRAAQADAKEMELHGEGVANQRIALAKGAKTSVDTLKEAGIDANEASRMVTMIQWMDMQRDLAKAGQT